MKNVVFRCDSSIYIGAGHMYRCLVLADELQNSGLKVSFLSRENPGNLNELITKKGIRLFKMNPTKIKNDIKIKNFFIDYNEWLGVSQKEDAIETINLIKNRLIGLGGFFLEK